MKKQNIYQALDNLAAQHTPDDIDFAPAIRRQLRERRQLQVLPRRNARIISLPYPLRLVAGLALCLCVAVTTVYAVVQLRTQDPGLVDEMITPINLSQTEGDMTFTVDWAYADANRVVLGYSLSREGGNIANNWLTDVVLTGTEGGRYYPIGAFGLDRSMPEMLSSDAHFDASIVENGTGEDAPEVLNLHLKVKNTFKFDFSVPFTPGVRVEDGTPVEVNGIEARIEWAVITPSMARVSFCYEMPEGGPWYPRVQLAYDGERVARGAGASDFLSPQKQADGTWCRQDNFLTTYREFPKTLTLTITSMQTPTYYNKEHLQRMSEVYAKYGITAEVVKNTAAEWESYLLTFPDLPNDIDPDLLEQIGEEARLYAGAPLAEIGEEEGERIDGPWVLTMDVPVD
jgi:hypothetical protein